jgi:hypothetical protein
MDLAATVKLPVIWQMHPGHLKERGTRFLILMKGLDINRVRKIMDKENNMNNKTSTSWGSTRDLLCTALAVALGLVVGWLDLHVTEVLVTILSLLASGLLPGLLQPSAAWRWALLIAIGLPLMELIAIKFSLPTAEPVQLDLRIALVALVFAMLGAYVGVFIRYIMRT